MNFLKRIRQNKGFSLVLLISTSLWLISLVIYLSSANTSRTEIINVESRRAVDHYEHVLHKVFDHISRIEVFTETVGLEDLTEEKFDEFTRNSSFSDVGFISLSIAPNGIIQYYYSDDFSSSLVGLDLINDDREHVTSSVQKAINEKVIVVNGPFNLLQGGNGLVFRKAVFDDEKFSAIINFGVKYEELNLMFEKNKSEVIKLGIYDEDNMLIFGDLQYSDDLDNYGPLSIEGVDWYFGVQVEESYQSSMIASNVTIVFIAFLLYLIALVFGTIYYRSNKVLLLTQEKLINYDNLTELPNRRQLAKDIEEAIDSNIPFFLGFGDLDNFKNLNDILGHTVGDNYLKDISKRFHKISDQKLTIYRWGGDEFIFLFKTNTKDKTIELLNKIYMIFKKPIIIRETNYSVSMSIGIVNYPKHGNTMDGLIKRADIVMYDIKSQQKNTYGFFEDKYLDNLRREVDFENKLYEYSIDDIEVYLQPVLSIQSNEITGFEALSRLFDKNGNAINTAEMIKVYERKGDIFKLDKHIIKNVFQYSIELKKRFKKEYSIAFNISPITLSEEYVDYLEQMIKDYKVNPENFIIEIIETTGFKDIDESVMLLNKLKKIGFRIAMDDFGIGFSSLSYITKLPLSLIKIDRNFVSNYQSNKFDKLLILTIVDISKSLDIEIVVEGIEKQEQLDFLGNVGAHFYQGYLHSKPMSFKKVLEFLSK